MDEIKVLSKISPEQSQKAQLEDNDLATVVHYH